MTANATRYLALVMSVLLMASIAIPLAVAGATATDGDLTLEVTQHKADGEVEVILTDNNTAEANATINVSGDTYAGNGTHDLDENGTTTLPEPNQTVSVTIEAETEDNETVSDTFELVPRSDSLALDLVQAADGTATVTVTQYEDPVENATVNVSTVDENETYVGTGEYTTDADGNVSLGAPTEPVNISVQASVDDLSTSDEFPLETATGLSLSVEQADDYSVVIDLTYNGEAVPGEEVNVTGEYEYAGTHMTDENGTVELPAPVNDTTINVSADYENETAEVRNFEISARNDSNPNNDFAEALVDFIHHLQFDDLERPPGQVISDFVHEHNPSKADDKAGPPEHAGPPDHAGPKNESVNETAGNATDGQGPPDHAGPPEDKSDKGKNKTKEPGPPDDVGPEKDD